MYLGKNLRYLRKKKGLTQSDIAGELGVKRTMISAYEEGRSEPKLAALNILAGIFNISVDEFLNRDIETSGKLSQQKQQVKVLAITVDREDRENITLVGQKASAGYLNGFSDPEFIGQLPQLHLPQLSQNATYRAFEIKGDSMLPLGPGTIVIGSYVEQAGDVKNGKTYVLVTATEGLVYKRVYNALEEKGTLSLRSDNDLYESYEIPGHDILEIWEARAFISADFPDPTAASHPLTLEDLGKMIMSLKTEIKKLR